MTDFVVKTWYEHVPSQPKGNIKGEYHNFMLDGNKHDSSNGTLSILNYLRQVMLKK